MLPLFADVGGTPRLVIYVAGGTFEDAGARNHGLKPDQNDIKYYAYWLGVIRRVDIGFDV